MTRTPGSEVMKNHVTNVHCTDDCVVVDLADDRVVGIDIHNASDKA